MSKSGTKRHVPSQQSVTEVKFRAGCGREWSLVSAEPDLAYTELVFQECLKCTHRVEPDGGPPFCTLRPVDHQHPFAALSGLEWPDEPCT